jgi:hypothetical protein
LDENKYYVKIVELDKIYNFLDENVFIQKHLGFEVFINKSSQIYFKNIDSK